MGTEAFLDTSYAIALPMPGDRFHASAMHLSVEIERAGTKLVTTQAVALEIGNALSKLRYRREAVIILNKLQADPKIEVVPLSQHLYARGLRLFQDRPDKEWSLTDCISCIVMRDRRIAKVLTTDEHFRQMGFDVLLTEK